MKQFTSTGIFPDITSDGTYFYICYVANNEVCVDKLDISAGIGSRVFTAPCSGVGFARIKFVNNQLHLIYRLGNGQTVKYVNITSDIKREYTGTFYNWPVILGLNGYAINDITLGNAFCNIYDYAGNLIKSLPPIPGTGIAYLQDDNVPVSNDSNRGSEGTLKMYNPERAGDGIIVGEAFTGGAQLADKNTGNFITLWSETNTYVPKITKYGNEYAVVTGDYVNISLMYNIFRSDINGTVPPPVYNPKEDLIKIRAELDAVIAKL